MVSISISASPAPELYHVGEHICIDNAGAIDILKDYHLTVRIGKQRLFHSTREMCIAANHDVAELFIRHGQRLLSRDTILSRDPWFEKVSTIGTPLVHDCELMSFMIMNGYEDLLPTTTKCMSHLGKAGFEMVFDALIKSKSIPAFKWALDIYWLTCSKLAHSIASRVDSDPTYRLMVVILIKRYPTFLDDVIGHIPFDMIMSMISDNIITLNDALESAFNMDKLDVFDQLAAAGADIGVVNFYDGVVDGVKQCLMRVVPADIDTHRLIESASVAGSIKFIAENFDLSVDDYNYGL